MEPFSRNGREPKVDRARRRALVRTLVGVGLCFAAWFCQDQVVNLIDWLGG